MAAMNVTTLTVQPAGWNQMVENHKKAKVILEKHGARNVRLLAPVALQDSCVGSTSTVIATCSEAAGNGRWQACVVSGCDVGRHGGTMNAIAR
jgi:hypothetical protein